MLSAYQLHQWLLITKFKFANLTDQFMLKAGCRSIYTKQSVAGMQPAEYIKLQEQIFMNHAFTLTLWGITSQQDILRTDTAELGKTDDIAISFSWIQLIE